MKTPFSTKGCGTHILLIWDLRIEECSHTCRKGMNGDSSAASAVTAGTFLLEELWLKYVRS